MYVYVCVLCRAERVRCSPPACGVHVDTDMLKEMTYIVLLNTYIHIYIHTHTYTYSATMLALAIAVASKWLILGRRKAGEYNWDASPYCQRWQFYRELLCLSPIFEHVASIRMTTKTTLVWLCANVFWYDAVICMHTWAHALWGARTKV
jgi:hypothetical protein